MEDGTSATGKPGVWGSRERPQRAIMTFYRAMNGRQPIG
jgi:hypothetical protein